MSMSMCLGITIGPIVATLSNASSPAGLWFCSTFFSNLTRRLCSSFTKKYSGEIEILSPFFSLENDEDSLKDGVGKYHDRIIIRFKNNPRGDELQQEIQKIIQQVKKESVDDFPEEFKDESQAESFFQDYLQIHYVLADEDKIYEEGKPRNLILELSPYLDTLELMQTYPVSEKGNLFHKILTYKESPKNEGGSNENKNKLIKGTKLLQDVDEGASQLLKSNGNIWSIQEIANCHDARRESNLKKYNYYAVVQADGDNMGNMLKGISLHKDIEAFSGNLLDYAKCAADMVGEFGGMTIYAGGDDLLFLAPVENTDGKTVFDLCKELNKMFIEKLRNVKTEAENNISLSFGISIQHNKFPLYEALNKARWLLENVAKEKTKKAMAIEIQKHSGQTVGIRLPLDGFEFLKEKYGAVKDKLSSCSEKNITANSIIKTIFAHSGSLTVLEQEMEKRIALGKDDRQNFIKVWQNFQDNAGQGDIKEYYIAVGNMFYDCFLRNNCGLEVLEKDHDIGHNIQALTAFLRIAKFLQEKRGEDE